MQTKTTLVALLLPLMTVAQQSAWGQCGGIGWTGATTCVSGYYCSALNDWYYQCIPGAASTTTTTSKPISSTTTTSATPTPTSSHTTLSTTFSTTTTRGTTTISSNPSTTLSGGTGATSGVGPGTTLQSGYYWIRAVESPNFHKYLQTNPEYTTGVAIMDNYTTAGQFNIVDGQLVELIDTKGTLLYANVEPQENSTVTKLAVTFSTSKNTYGTFLFSGDAVEWSIPSISRPNLAAWLVCANQQLFINLGAYDYNTPAGCADETIHYYNGATAVD